MTSRVITSTIFLLLLMVTLASVVSGQALDISSGGQPTITGALNGSVSGSSNVQNDLIVTINFGEVSPSNANSIVKVVVPIGIRSDQPYQVALSITGLTNANPQALRAADIGLGVGNMRVMGGGGKVCTQSSHVVPASFNNDPANTATIGANGRVSYQSSLASLLGPTVILSGPRLSKSNSANRQGNDGYIFDAIFALTPQFFAPGVSSATLIFTISAGPNVPC